MRKVINKVYEKVKEYIKDNWVSIIILVVFAVFCFYDTGYSIYKPGGTINASNRVSGDNLYDSDGSFNMAYVSMLKGRLPYYLFAKYFTSWNIVKNDNLTVSELEDMSDVIARDNLYYKRAIKDAIYVAFKESNVDFKVDSTDYYIFYKSLENDSDLKIGDKLISYDEYNFNGVDDFAEYINSKNEGDIIKIKYERNNKELETKTSIYKNSDKLYVGLSVVPIINIESDYNLEVKTKGSESGPSGGLITTLAIYNALTKEDITRGKKIVGTGTISSDGKVGEIGEVAYKLAAAEKAHADIFICPKENYEEALKFAKEKKYDILIVEVSSFEETINYLKNMEEN